MALVIGGYNHPRRLSSAEIYPPIVGCNLPSLPETRFGHAAFVHNDAVTICGGQVHSSGSSSSTSSCLVLNVQNQRWETNLITDLMRTQRKYHASVSVEKVGSYLIGGNAGNGEIRVTSDFLAHGATEWVAGPDLPVSMSNPCAVKISQLNFLVINGNDIREYQVDVTNPTSSSGWQDANKWPRLQTGRRSHPGCAVTTDNKVVIAGGESGSTYLRSSEVLDLSTGTITNGGDMIRPRAWFHLATTSLGGATKMFAIGGRYSSEGYSKSVEEFHPSNNSWTLAPTALGETRGFFGRVEVEVKTICPT